jgi:hypothetical protein
MNDLPDRELTPLELRELIESNAKAIQANREANAELLKSFRLDREACMEPKTPTTAELKVAMFERFAAIDEDLQRLARLSESLFPG